MHYTLKRGNEPSRFTAPVLVNDDSRLGRNVPVLVKEDSRFARPTVLKDESLVRLATVAVPLGYEDVAL